MTLDLDRQDSTCVLSNMVFEYDEKAGVLPASYKGRDLSGGHYRVFGKGERQRYTKRYSEIQRGRKRD